MKYFLLLSFLPLLLLQGCKDEGADISSDPNIVVIKTQQGNSFTFNVELALSPAQQAQGLMNRPSMPQNSGMLFVFPDSAERRFWMKNTLIPLDIIYIRADGIIHHIHHNAVPLDMTGIPSKGPVKGVLEINGGLAQRLGIKAGQKVLHPSFNP